jgi:hypothetical protein
MRSTFCLGLFSAMITQPVSALAQASTTALPSAFSSIFDPAERSRAVFAEAARVLTHPRLQRPLKSPPARHGRLCLIELAPRMLRWTDLRMGFQKMV